MSKAAGWAPMPRPIGRWLLTSGHMHGALVVVSNPCLVHSLRAQCSYLCALDSQARSASHAWNARCPSALPLYSAPLRCPPRRAAAASPLSVSLYMLKPDRGPLEEGVRLQAASRKMPARMP